MKLKTLIKNLEKIENKLVDDVDVVVDYANDEGWYDLDAVAIVDHNGKLMLNLDSSNEC